MAEKQSIGPLRDPRQQFRDTAEDWRDKIYLKWLQVWRWTRPKLPSFFAFLFGLLGWSAVSIGLYFLIGHQWILWVCGGALMLTGLGWRTVAEIAWDGIYVKWKRDQEENSG